MSAANLYEVIRAPRVSEKTARLQEVSNQYVFEIAKTATKADVKAAVEKICSTAAFTSALVAVFAISKTYWLETSCRRAVFSDTRGARITSYMLAVLMPATPRSS